MSERSDAGSALLSILGGAAGAGLLVGALLGSTGSVSLLSESETLAEPAIASYFDCPDGAALGTFGRGDRVLITGRDESGEWAEVRSPESSNSRVWMRSRQVLADGDTTGLPVVECNVPVDAVVGDIPVESTTTIPGQTTTTIAATTTTVAVPPPTAVPLPTVGPVSATPGAISEVYPGIDPICSPNESLIRATVTAAAGVKSVTLHWSINGSNFSKPMGFSNGTYVGVLGKFYNDSPNAVPQGESRQITVIVRVIDDLGRQAENQTTVTLNDCP